MIFLHYQFGAFCGDVCKAIQFPFSLQKNFSSYQMDSTQVAQWIQTLIASVDELTRQNSELRQITEAQSDKRNEERKENNNDEEAVDPLNHRRRTPEGENSPGWKRCSTTQRKMDKLRRANSDKYASNLDSMILASIAWIVQLIKRPLDHIESFKTLMHL